MSEYRIEYQIQRREGDDEDFVEIGFGSSGASGDIKGALYALESYVANGQWETEGDQPDPDDVLRDIATAKENADD